MKLRDLTNKNTKDSLCVESFDLIIVYNVYGTLLQISQSTFEHSTIKFSLLDVEEDNKTGESSIEFSSFKELEDIIKDFKNKFNNLNK